MGWRRHQPVAAKPVAPLDLDAEFFPEGWTIELHGNWTIEVSNDLATITTQEVGTITMRPQGAGDARLENFGQIQIRCPGAPDFTAAEGPAWLPWQMWAVMWGALAPRVMAEMQT